MNQDYIIRQRLINQQLVRTDYTKPADLLQHMVAMQAQEFAMAKWAVGLRLPGTTEADIDKAFNNGNILRTHLLRPTWHFVSPADIRWLLALTAARVHAANAFMYRKLELDAAVFSKSIKLLEKILKDKQYLMRTDIADALSKNNIAARGMRMAYILMHAELEAVICSGPRQGKQFTYALLEERVKPVKGINREEALVYFTERYFTSRGPASIKDFCNWSGLAVKEARKGVEALPSTFIHEQMNGETYIFLPAESSRVALSRSCFLMPDYDEYGMSYKNRSALSPLTPVTRPAATGYEHMLVVEGRVAGTWQKTGNALSPDISIDYFTALNSAKQKAVINAVRQFNTFFSGE